MNGFVVLLILILNLQLIKSIDTDFSNKLLFPVYPDAFKTRISGVIEPNVTFSIEQYYYKFKPNNNETGKAVFNTDTSLRGLIHDDTKNHSIRYNFTSCSMAPLTDTKSYYEPFSFFSESEIAQNKHYAALVDVFKMFQNKTCIHATKDVTENDVAHVYYTHVGKEGSRYPFTIQVDVNRDSKTIESVEINSTVNNTTKRLISMRYDSIIPISASDKKQVTLPPHNVFCRADNHKVAIPLLGLFYAMDIRVLSEYYRRQNDLSLIKMSEYVYDNMVSVGYYSTLEPHIHYSRIVHNYATGVGARVNTDRGLCTRYTLTFNTSNSTLQTRKDLFRAQVLTKMSFFERKYFVRFWKVIELLKDENVGLWEYQGVRTIDTTECNVWSYPLGKDFIAEVAFTIDKIELRESSYRSKSKHVLVSVDLYQTDNPDPDEPPAISFRISNYQIDSNPVSTELSYDTSMCYQDPKDMCTVQFKLGLGFSSAHEYGIGAVKRAISKALVTETRLESHQIHHIGLSPVPNNQCLVTFTAYHGLGNNIVSIQLFQEKLKRVINERMTVTFASDDGDKIQVVHSVPNSLVFDYSPLSSDTWSVSVAATISMCVGTAFIGIIIGVISVNCWFKKKNILSTADNSPNYRRFKDDEIEEVDIGL